MCTARPARGAPGNVQHNMTQDTGNLPKLWEKELNSALDGSVMSLVQCLRPASNNKEPL